MRGRDVPDVISHVGPTTAAAATAPPVEEKKKGGRPSKEELRRHKLAMASAGIASLMEAKPTKKKIHEYMEKRILELEMEKR
jgi:ribosomal protein L12E/L44/L45/RPP1/RPP2